MQDGTADRSLSAALKEKRSRLITCWGDRITSAVAASSLPRAELLDHIPAFVDELIRALHPEAVPLPPVSANAEEHGEQRFGLGFDVAEVVREYGMLHESILQVAGEAEVVINPREHEVLVKWLNMGIADAVAEYVKQRDLELHRAREPVERPQIVEDVVHELGVFRLCADALCHDY